MRSLSRPAARSSERSEESAPASAEGRLIIRGHHAHAPEPRAKTSREVQCRSRVRISAVIAARVRARGGMWTVLALQRKRSAEQPKHCDPHGESNPRDSLARLEPVAPRQLSDRVAVPPPLLQAPRIPPSFNSLRSVSARCAFSSEGAVWRKRSLTQISGNARTPTRGPRRESG